MLNVQWNGYTSLVRLVRIIGDIEMTPEQQKFYLLGLEDAIKEIQSEIAICNAEMTGEALYAWKYALINAILAIKDLSNDLAEEQ